MPPPPAASRPTISEDLRHFISTSGKSAYRLERESGVSRSTISRFLRGHSSLTLENASALAGTLGLEFARTDDTELLPFPGPGNTSSPAGGPEAAA